MTDPNDPNSVRNLGSDPNVVVPGLPANMTPAGGFGYIPVTNAPPIQVPPVQAVPAPVAMTPTDAGQEPEEDWNKRNGTPTLKEVAIHYHDGRIAIVPCDGGLSEPPADPLNWTDLGSHWLCMDPASPIASIEWVYAEESTV